MNASRLFTPEQREYLESLPRDDHGLRKQDPLEQGAHTSVLMRCAQLWRDGIRISLPQISRRAK